MKKYIVITDSGNYRITAAKFERQPKHDGFSEGLVTFYDDHNNGVAVFNETRLVAVIDEAAYTQN